jgi:hypothetical protein
MRKFGLSLVLGLVLLAGMGASAGFAQSSAPPGTVDDMKAASLAKLQALNKRVLMFAREMPAEKYTWNPGLMLVPAPPDPQADPYGRTVADLFLHIAMLNFTRPGQLGAQAPEGFDPKNYETSTTDKAKVIEQLTRSFAYAQDALQKVSSSDLQKQIKVGGPNNTSQSGPGMVFVMAWIDDLSEYEGQTIAYGRLNGVIGTGETFALRPAGK